MSKAVSYSQYGGPEVLELVEVEVPQPEPDQVRVAVRAAGVNPFDFKVRRGGYIPGHSLPSRQGVEFAGIVDVVGSEVSQFKPGDEVLGWANSGAQAEYVVVPAKQLAPKPAELDWAIAGGLGLSANTARRSIDALELTHADTVLVTGAAGGVGIVAVQFARDLGAKVVGTSSPRNHEFLESLGVIPVAYGEGELDRLRAAAPQGYTAALDTVGGQPIETAIALGITPERINTIADHSAVEKYGIKAVGGSGKTSAELDEFARAAASGALVLPIRATYRLGQVQDAYRELETGHGLGKVVLLIP